jgi:hypothetical protein
MNMGMRLEFLIPGMEDAEEPDLGAKALGIAGDFDQRLGAGPEQAIDLAFVREGSSSFARASSQRSRALA